MFVKLVQVMERSFLERAMPGKDAGYTTIQTYMDSYFLQPFVLNIDNIVYLRKDLAMKAALKEGKLPKDMLNEQEFTKIFMSCSSNSNSSMIVVGSVNSVLEKIVSVK